MVRPVALAQDIPITGMHIQYYFTCKRKLWFLQHYITMEHESEDIKIGRLHHKHLENKEVAIENIRLDDFRKGKVWELKKSKRNVKASRFQVYYYLWVLQRKGVNTSAEIHYKDYHQTEQLELTPAIEEELQQAMQEIKKLFMASTPPKPVKRTSKCKKCPYYELCYI